MVESKKAENGIHTATHRKRVEVGVDEHRNLAKIEVGLMVKVVGGIESSNTTSGNGAIT